MNISISTSFNYDILIGEQIKMLNDLGFKCISIGGNYNHSGILDSNRLDCLHNLLQENLFKVDTIHGYAMDKTDTIEVNKKIVDAAQKLNAPVVVLHCSSFAFNPNSLDDRRKDITIKLSEFETLAKETGIKFAFENVLPGVATDFMEEVLNGSNPEFFGFCYDSAHDQIDGPRPFDLLERQENRLFAVHISDRIMELVDHVTPGEGFVDFDAICTHLKNASISFPLLMEVMMTHSKYKDPYEFLRVTKCEAEKLYEKIY